MAKEEATANDTTDTTTNETAGAGMLAAGQPEEQTTGEDTAAADTTFAPLGQYIPSPEDRRQRALELAVGYAGNDREPINSVLARAQAYHAYVNDGTVPAGVA